MGIEQLTEIEPEFWEEQRRIHAQVVRERNPQHSQVEIDMFDALLRLKSDYARRYHEWRNNPPQDKALWAEMMEDQKHSPAMMIVHNYDGSINPHYKHAVNGTWHNAEYGIVGNYIGDRERFGDLVEIAKKDNATVTDDLGTVLAHGVYIDNPEVKKLLIERSSDHPKFARGWQILGFKVPVNARHFSAMGGSYELGTPITTYSEETGDIRRFENGDITYSSVPDETAKLEPYTLRLASLLPEGARKAS